VIAPTSSIVVVVSIIVGILSSLVLSNDAGDNVDVVVIVVG